MAAETADAGSDAALAAALLAVDPVGLRGIVLKGPPGPERDMWLAQFGALQAHRSPPRRLPLHATPARLLGGLDLAATLEAGRPLFERGLLAAADGGTLLIGSAERLDRHAAALISSVIDCREVLVERDGLTARHPASFAVVALDESLQDEDGVAATLSDRLAMICSLGAPTPRDFCRCTIDDVNLARLRLAGVEIREEWLSALDDVAAQFGVRSLHVLFSAARVARASAALAGRTQVAEDDLFAAARLVIGPRATVLPIESVPDPPEQQCHGDQPQPESSEPNGEAARDMIVAAARSSLPPDLLATLSGGPAIRRSLRSGRSGQRIKGARRGRPAGVRAARLDRGDRLNVLETLRAAAPWQRIRRSSSSDSRRLLIRPDDFRTPRLKHKAETAAIFVVDASGSTAFARLSEAKGAIELLLAHCYVRRDQVALIAFGGRGADLLLPPTRSLTRARRDLADLPGGGGTPLASGIAAAAKLAAQVRRRGQTPLLILLTDGRANLAIDGTADRTRAMSDALTAAAAIKAGNIPGILIDTSSRRASDAARRVAEAMGARYLPLPHGDAETLSHAVSQHARRCVP
jgi:magnesium chelatase subunit D